MSWPQQKLEFVLFSPISLTPPHPTCHQILSILLPPKYLSNVFSHPSPTCNPEEPWYFYQSTAPSYHMVSLLSSWSSSTRCCCSESNTIAMVQLLSEASGTVWKRTSSHLCVLLNLEYPLEVLSSWSSQFHLLVPIPIGYFLQNPIRSIPCMPQLYAPGTHYPTFQLQRCS